MRRFMDYVEVDGTITNDRWKFLGVATAAPTLIFAAIPFFLGASLDVVLWTGLGFGATGAVGALIAFALDYM